MRRLNPFVLGSIAAVLLGACAGPARDRHPVPEARAFTGDRSYFTVPLTDAKRAEHEANLAAAKARYDADPANEDAIIWHGRRLAYLGRFREAIDVYSRGLEVHPDSVRLLRHRGHRYITTRRLDLAVGDLQRAADLIRANAIPDEIEPDGLPNARNIPLSTLHDNVHYHLALARYLRGEFADAAEAWRAGLDRVTPNDDMLVAYSFWLSLAESRAGNAPRAAEVLHAVGEPLDIIENHAYLRLIRLAQGALPPAEAERLAPEGPEGASTDTATLLHGLGAFALIRGDHEEARRRFEACMRTNQWPAFGFIAAEAELARFGRRPVPDERSEMETIREIQKERRGVR
jgi:tetratricopeptide (TPR) repeat protein